MGGNEANCKQYEISRGFKCPPGCRSCAFAHPVSDEAFRMSALGLNTSMLSGFHDPQAKWLFG